jgi:hypothetical protein
MMYNSYYDMVFFFFFNGFLGVHVAVKGWRLVNVVNGLWWAG